MDKATGIIPPEFIKTEQPKDGSAKWYKLHRSNNFGVKIENNILKIKKIVIADKSKLRISNGVLRGIDNGEWGGILSFIPNDKSKKEINIKYGNIKFIFEFNNKTYFIEGVQNIISNYGIVFELDKNDFTYKKILVIDDTPNAFTIFKNKLLIATNNNFYILFYVINSFKKELVFKNTFWRSLYPNSIAAIDDENVFVGIRGGVVKLDLIYRTMDFYKHIK